MGDLIAEARARVGNAPPLPRDAFFLEVKRALRMVDRPDLLCTSPLLGCRMLARGQEVLESADARAARLRALLLEACALVRDRYGDLRGWEVLERTYLRPAVKQLVAADELGLSFATYRRALAVATARVTEILWERELEARAGASWPFAREAGT